MTVILVHIITYGSFVLDSTVSLGVVDLHIHGLGKRMQGHVCRYPS
jgi:hypothetical protein